MGLDTGTALAERELNRQNGNSTGRTGNRTGRTGTVGRGLCDRPQLRAPANNKSHEWVSIRELNWQNVNSTGRTGTQQAERETGQAEREL